MTTYSDLTLMDYAYPQILLCEVIISSLWPPTHSHSYTKRNGKYGVWGEGGLVFSLIYTFNATIRLPFSYIASYL